MTVEEIVAALQAIVDGAAGGEMSEEDMERYEGLEKDLERARKQDEILKRQAAYKTVQVQTKAVTTKALPEEERGWDHYLRTGVANQDIVNRAQSEGTGTAGGFFVPESFRNKMVERMKEFGGVGNNCEQISTERGEPMYWVTNDDTSNVGAIVAEGGVVTTGGADLVFGSKQIGAYKYGSGGASNLPLKVSQELLQDSSFDITGYIARKLGERLERAMADDLVNGSGVGEPTGLLSTAGGLGDGTAFSSNTAPTYADFITQIHDLDPAYRGQGCVWVFNDGFLEVLRKVEDDVARPILWNQNGTLADAPQGMTLLGYPVIIDQACAAPSTGNAFGFFGNLRETYVNELYAVNGHVGYMAWCRMDATVQNTFAGFRLKANG
jgi:HK97 family phage major capsid protein